MENMLFFLSFPKVKGGGLLLKGTEEEREEKAPGEKGMSKK